VVARVVTNEELALQQAQLDQTLRNGLGVELRESVAIRPVTVPNGVSRFVADAILGRSRYVIARVQTADLATLEQGACALTPLALRLLGIESGDNVLLEGCAQPASNVVQTVKVRAFEAPSDMTSLRQSVSGGTLGARFPSATEALGVFPDLPWAFLDERTRQTLGLSKLEPVRIRAARGQQVGKEVRELALVIALGLIGVLISHLSAVVRILALIALGLLIVGIVVFRLRTRLARGRPPDSG
jgi:hypothetical protein